jgi:PAS domain-containing protein
MTIVTLAMGVFVLHYIERRLVAATGQNLTLAAAEIADKLDRLLFERHGDALMMARTFRPRMDDPSFLSAYLQSMKEAYAPVYLWLGVLDAGGTLVVSTDPDLVGRDWRRQQWFEAARDSRSVHVGEVSPYEAVNGLEAVAFTAPVFGNKGEFLGVVSTRVGIQMLENVLTQTIQAMKTRLAGSLKIEYQFLTHAGQVFIDSDLAHKGGVNLKQAGLTSALLGDTGQPGYVEEEDVRRHVPVVTGYARTGGYGDFEGPKWTVLIRMDRDDILSPVRVVLVNIGIAGAVVWLPMFAALLWATGRLRREWAQTQQEAGRAQVAEAARQHSEARTRESEERYRSVVAALKNGVVLLDGVGIVQASNASAERMLGVAAGELIGTPFATAMRQVVYEDGTPCEAAMLPPMVTIRTGEPCSGVILGIRREKRPVEWLSMNSRPLNAISPAISPAHPRHAETCRLPGPEPAETGPFTGVYEQGARVVVVSFTDVTEQKRAEQRLRVQHAITGVVAEATTLKEAASLILETLCEP